MNSELSRRLGRLKVPAMLKMRYHKGPYELVNWWQHFLRSVPQGAGFDDLNVETQNLILEWERNIIKSITSGVDSKEMDLETKAIYYEWEKEQ